MTPETDIDGRERAAAKGLKIPWVTTPDTSLIEEPLTREADDGSHAV
jgi:hypothetical protein